MSQPRPRDAARQLPGPAQQGQEKKGIRCNVTKGTGQADATRGPGVA